MEKIILPFLISWVAGLILVPLVRRIALKLGLVDRPGGRKIHTKPIPRIGGLAIYVGSMIGALPFLSESSPTLGVMLAGTFVFIIGFLDDLLDLKAKIKLAGQIVGCGILFAYGVKISFMTNFLSGQGMFALGLLTYPLTLLWVIGLTNTVNLVDGVDGLAGGIVFIALSTLIAVRALTPQMQDPELMNNVMALSAALMGSLFGFLKYNVSPASIFMGDSGAYYLGFMTAALSVAGGAKGSILFPLIIPLIAFGLPIIDVIFAILRRYFKKVPIFQADKGHLHHRLLNRGFTQKQTTRFLWMVSACFGFVAILAADIPHRGIQTAAAIMLVIMLFLSVFYFIRHSNNAKKNE
ncbi:MAG: undecaprenyl/decaprenyl-phosphate alpha-N-acetylglucosaminyl 1-phosphate transferase [Candidatus Riflebacteria bacterium]|nr:undecaprenyl/decaprenyl-phosphate alpha-N-acetylglucosaminyl 1-phosphate transferase [Candidatus Riflebacteria bacterium]